KGFLMPYHGTPQPPQEEMREYHVRKDNTVQYRGNYYSLPCGTYRSGQTTVWLQETEGNVELYNKDTGKLICRHALCTRKGRTVYDDSHRKPRN
ncbi:IS21 family transposase, partial [Phocaeicola vulgatus]|nr:IS21 family transposase [Phocaeicola vulgatus]MCE8867962.1 IS21 family transposase [Phocaeicola vulgatus]MCE9363427.1 IS21 family transposase [Phocaeicola vulgatus]MCE9367160.1 IS21 family transposase [Phocaeicola vulgatus]MCE9410739.1 IS21 family transposase [Phocaeicola vulgatus]